MFLVCAAFPVLLESGAGLGILFQKNHSENHSLFKTFFFHRKAHVHMFTIHNYIYIYIYIYIILSYIIYIIYHIYYHIYILYYRYHIIYICIYILY